MTMPIAHREMLLLARSPATYRARLGTGIVTVVVGSALALIYANTAAGALPFLGILSYFLTLLCMFTGAQMTADGIASEKREGTLGLLFLTGLRPWQITSGKLVANGAAAFFRLLVTFPLLSMLLIMGGVLPSQIFLMALVLLNTLFVTGCMGLYASTVSLEQKRAAGSATALVMLFWMGLPIGSQINSSLGGPLWLSEGLLLCSLNSSFLPSTMGPRFGAAAAPWLNLVCVHAIGWLFFGLATWTLPSQCQDKPERKKWSLKEWWRRLSYGNAHASRRLRERLLTPNPFLWLASRDRLRFLNIWIFTLAMIGLAVWVYSSTKEFGPLLAVCLGASVVHRFLVAAGGGAQLMIEQEQGTLEMLLSTPLSAHQVLQGQFRASFRQMIGPVLLLVLFQGLALLPVFVNPQAVNGTRIALMIGVATALYLLDLYTALWISMWAAVISRNPKQAGGAAIARLLGFPFFVVAMFSLATVVLNTLFGAGLNPSPALLLVAFCVLLVVNDLYWLRRTHRELPERLRGYAFRRYAPDEPVGLFGTLGRTLGRWYGNRRAVQPS